MGRFGRGFALLSASWKVLKGDPKLLAFPALSLVASVLVMAAVAAPFAIWPDLIGRLPGRHGEVTGEEVSRVWVYGAMFLFYFATNFVVVFFNAALISSVMTRLQGGVPTVTGGLAAAAARLPQIVAWAAFTATVGVILKALEERVPFLGKIVLRMVGFAWAVVTYFVVPVVALERLGPFAAVRRSGELLKKSWGENLAGGFGLFGIGLLLSLPGIAMLFLGFYLGFQGSQPSIAPIIAGGGLALAWFVATGTIVSALNQIFVANAYVYAVEGRLPAGFSEELMTGAFRRR